jgi:hypothetical protein
MKGKLSFLIVLLFVVSSILYAEDGQVYTQRKGIRIKYADTAESNSYSQSSTVNNSFRPVFNTLKTMPRTIPPSL